MRLPGSMDAGALRVEVQAHQSSYVLSCPLTVADAGVQLVTAIRGQKGDNWASTVCELDVDDITTSDDLLGAFAHASVYFDAYGKGSKAAGLSLCLDSSHGDTFKQIYSGIVQGCRTRNRFWRLSKGHLRILLVPEADAETFQGFLMHADAYKHYFELGHTKGTVVFDLDNTLVEAASYSSTAREAEQTMDELAAAAASRRHTAEQPPRDGPSTADQSPIGSPATDQDTTSIDLRMKRLERRLQAIRQDQQLLQDLWKQRTVTLHGRTLYAQTVAMTTFTSGQAEQHNVEMIITEDRGQWLIMMMLPCEGVCTPMLLRVRRDWHILRSYVIEQRLHVRVQTLAKQPYADIVWQLLEALVTKPSEGAARAHPLVGTVKPEAAGQQVQLPVPSDCQFMIQPDDRASCVVCVPRDQLKSVQWGLGLEASCPGATGHLSGVVMFDDRLDVYQRDSRDYVVQVQAYNHYDLLLPDGTLAPDWEVRRMVAILRCYLWYMAQAAGQTTKALQRKLWPGRYCLARHLPFPIQRKREVWRRLSCSTASSWLLDKSRHIIRVPPLDVSLLDPQLTGTPAKVFPAHGVSAALSPAAATASCHSLPHRSYARRLRKKARGLPAKPLPPTPLAASVMDAYTQLVKESLTPATV